MSKFLMNFFRSYRKILIPNVTLEQYSRCQCLRIEGILKPQKEKVEDVDLDRAHGIGPVYKDESDQELLN